MIRLKNDAKVCIFSRTIELFPIFFPLFRVILLYELHKKRSTRRDASPSEELSLLCNFSAKKLAEMFGGFGYFL